MDSPESRHARATEPARPPVAVVRAPDGTGIPGRYLVAVRDGMDVDSVARAHKVAPTRTYSEVLHGFAASLTHDALEALRRHPDVTAIE